MKEHEGDSVPPRSRASGLGVNVSKKEAAMPKQRPRNYRRYVVRAKRKIVHGGITERPLEEREAEHKRKWPNARVSQVGPAVTEETARKWEKEHGYS